MKRASKIFLVLIIIVAGIIIILGCYSWFARKQERVALGLAHSRFPYNDYSIDELNKLYPQYVNVDVKTTQTPEETHTKFITALKAGDLNNAVECCFRQGDWDKMKNGLLEVQKKGLLRQMVSDLDTIQENNINENKAVYSYSTLKDGINYGHTMTFIKDNQGIWLIESL